MAEEQNTNQQINSEPAWIHTGITPFAVTNFRGREELFGIKTDDRRRHMYIIGKTGMGKSTMLENMIVNDIIAGKGLAVVDPHGDLVEAVLKYIPTNRINDVIYFDPSDLDHPVGFNVLEQVGTEYTHLVASGLIGVFKKIWADSWGPRLEYILANAILALLASDGNTMLGITRMLVDKSYRKKVVTKISDPMVKSFWVDEFENYNDRFRSEAIAPIQNKVGQFLSSSIIRNIVGQTKSTINLSDIMNNKKILLLNLSKGKVGEENSALLGAMMITKIQLSAMERVRITEQEREDFSLFVDEFQNFATEAFATILSEARKYRLSLIMGHQYIKQVPEPVQDAVFGNVGTMIVFRIGAEDAERFELEFSEKFAANDFVNLERGHIYLRLMIDGLASKPFSAIGLPPLTEEQQQGNEDKIIRVSRERYAKERGTIEEKIARWAMTGIHPGPEGKGDNREGKQKVIYASRCDACGGDVETFFKPDPKKPIYCDTCFAKIKEEREQKKQQHEARTEAPATIKQEQEEYKKAKPDPSPTKNVIRSESLRRQATEYEKRNIQTKSENTRPNNRRQPQKQRPSLPGKSMKDALGEALQKRNQSANQSQSSQKNTSPEKQKDTSKQHFNTAQKNNRLAKEKYTQAQTPEKDQNKKPQTERKQQAIINTKTPRPLQKEQAKKEKSPQKNISNESTGTPLKEGETIEF